MGLARAALRFLIRLHREHPLQEPILLLGRQYVFATKAEVLRLAREENLSLALDVGEKTDSNIPGWENSGKISDVAFFKMLGRSEIYAADVSDYEQPDLLLDLNCPIPKEHEGRFGTVLDGGTIEHVFDIRQALANTAKLLKPGGQVIHMSPASNYVSHGYYCLTPRLFFDFYRTNGFTKTRGWLAIQGPDFQINDGTWQMFECSPERPGGLGAGLVTSYPIGLLFVAEKTPRATSDQIPYQQFETTGSERSGFGNHIAARKRLAHIARLLLPGLMARRTLTYAGRF